MTGLRLEVREFRDLIRWRWVLLDSAAGAGPSPRYFRAGPAEIATVIERAFGG